MVQQLIEAMQRAAGEVRRWPDSSVQLVHHNDSDGLTAGAVLTRAFERAGFAVRRLCMEKPYPQVLEKIFSRHGRLIVFADFAGRIAPYISGLNRGRNLVLILDHHKASQSTDALVHNLDPELFGLAGDRDITASTTCYLFARVLDPANRDLAAIAAVGAVGDGFFVDGRLAGPNRDVALEAARQGSVEIRHHGDGEDYIYRAGDDRVACKELADRLDTLGAAGYFRNGPEAGIRLCLEGAAAESDRLLEELKRTQHLAFAREIRRLGSGGLNATDHLQWFHVANRFEPMGVKVIGVFCDTYKDAPPFDPDRFTAGFQPVPDRIPGFGRVPLGQVKVSMRVSNPLAARIRDGRAPGLDTFLPEATARLGGFSDACHSLKAATTVAAGSETALIAEMEKIIRNNSPH